MLMVGRDVGQRVGMCLFLGAVLVGMMTGCAKKPPEADQSQFMTGADMLDAVGKCRAEIEAQRIETYELLQPPEPIPASIGSGTSAIQPPPPAKGSLEAWRFKEVNVDADPYLESGVAAVDANGTLYLWWKDAWWLGESRDHDTGSVDLYQGFSWITSDGWGFGLRFEGKAIFSCETDGGPGSSRCVACDFEGTCNPWTLSTVYDRTSKRAQ